MKKLRVSALFITLAVIFFSQVELHAQLRLFTRDMKLSDFTTKKTKVVLSGNDFYDEFLKSEVASRWIISPYEFCSVDDFERLKYSEEYYFLLILKKQETSYFSPVKTHISFLTILKGGEKAKQGLHKMLAVATLPYFAEDNPSGREFVFLPALIDILQEHIRHSMDDSWGKQSGFDATDFMIHPIKDRKVSLYKKDLAQDRSEYILDDGLLILEENGSDMLFTNNSPNTVCSFVIAPAKQEKGTIYYKMLIGADDHKLYYFKKDKVSQDEKAGFTTKDFRKINGFRKK